MDSYKTENHSVFGTAIGLAIKDSMEHPVAKKAIKPVKAAKPRKEKLAKAA
jgi:hypothetical protein